MTILIGVNVLKKRVIFISWHYFNSKRKAGFHFLADAFWQMGWEVIFITAPISLMSWLCKDCRFEYPIFKESNKLIKIKKRMWSYVLLTPWQPTNIKNNGILNALAVPLYNKYKNINLGILNDLLKKTSLVIFESTEAILLYERFKEINDRAFYIYRVSDDLELHRCHPVVLETEQRIAPQFDLISTPSSYIYKKFSRYPNSKLHYHGIRKDLFDKEYKNPYSGSSNAVFVGNSLFDINFIYYASELFPNWKFHILGPITNIPDKCNIITYGEMPFVETIPYLKYANIGLQTRYYLPGCESLTDSLKVIQYTYCKLPIIAPAFLKTDRNNFFYYEPDNPKSIKQALQDSFVFDCSKINTQDICSWDELAKKFIAIMCAESNIN